MQSILEKYTAEEIATLDSYIKHKRDENFTYAGLASSSRQISCVKIVLQRRNIWNSTVYVYDDRSNTMFANYPAETRMHYVKKILRCDFIV